VERDIHDYIPVIIGAIGMGTGVLKKVLETIPGKQSLDSAKKNTAWTITRDNESTAI